MLLFEDGLAVIHDTFPISFIQKKLAQLQLVNTSGTKHGYLGLLGFLAAVIPYDWFGSLVIVTPWYLLAHFST